MRAGFALALVLACLPATATAKEPPTLETRLAETLDDFRMRYGLPGATAAIVLPDGTLVTAGSGFADLEQRRAMTPETPMLAASIGKTFVAATVLWLESAGALARDDLLSIHLGDRPWFTGLPNAATITIDHLLHHTAGLPDHVHLPEFQLAFASQNVPTDFDPADLVRLIAGYPPLFEPGAGWAYSDTGYVLLGLVTEAVTGAPWQETVKAQFLGPLALHGTVASDRPDMPGLAVGYVAPDNPFGLPRRTADPGGRLVWNPAVESAGGGFASTSADLARWGHLLFGGMAMDTRYLDRLLDAAPVDPATPDIGYGAGVAIHASTPRGPVWGHAGWIPGYVSSLRHYAEHGVTVAFQINTDDGITGGQSDLVPTLESALANVALPIPE